MASFAPIAPCELRAFLPSIASPVEMPDEVVAEVAHGLAIALQHVGQPVEARYHRGMADVFDGRTDEALQEFQAMAARVFISGCSGGLSKR